MAQVTKAKLLQTPPMAVYGEQILGAVEGYKVHARAYFHEAVLSGFSCPRCQGGLTYQAPGRCRCGACGLQFDPTVEFQPCNCGGKLEFRRCHYACRSCRRVIPSRFIFDERLFDAAYFAEKMRESRQRKEIQKRELQALLQSSRSGVFLPDESPDWSNLEGFEEALGKFLLQKVSLAEFRGAKNRPVFDLSAYRKHLLEAAEGCIRRFDAFLPLVEDRRIDRIFRFVALVYLWHEGRVQLRHERGELWVEG